MSAPLKLSQRGEELDTLSRQRSLSEAESLELELEILQASGQNLPKGMSRELARHGIRRLDGRRYRSTKPTTENNKWPSQSSSRPA